MSNDNREYPAWLDEELFASLQDAPAPAAREAMSKGRSMLP